MRAHRARGIYRELTVRRRRARDLRGISARAVPDGAKPEPISRHKKLASSFTTRPPRGKPDRLDAVLHDRVAARLTRKGRDTPAARRRENVLTTQFRPIDALAVCDLILMGRLTSNEVAP